MNLEKRRPLLTLLFARNKISKVDGCLLSKQNKGDLQPRTASVRNMFTLYLMFKKNLNYLKINNRK